MGKHFSKILVANGALDLLVGLGGLVTPPGVTGLFPSLKKSLRRGTSTFGSRTAVWLLLLHGLVRIIAGRFPRQKAALNAGIASYIIEALWLGQEAARGNNATGGRVTVFATLAMAGVLLKRLVELPKATDTAGRTPSCLPISAVKRVIFIRHAQTKYNLACTDKDGKEGVRPIGGPDGTMSKDMQDYVDAPLTDTGVEQARAAGLVLQQKGVELVVVSPAERCMQTASMLFPQASVPDPQIPLPGGKGKRFVAYEGVRERIFAQAFYTQRKSISSKRKNWPAVDFTLIEDDEDKMFAKVAKNGAEIPSMEHMGKVERSAEVAHRALSILEWLKNRPEKTIAIVCHGMVQDCLFGDDKLKAGHFELAEVHKKELLLTDKPQYGWKGSNCRFHEVYLASRT